MKAFWVQMIDLVLSAMATNFVQKMANSALSSLWQVLGRCHFFKLSQKSIN